MAELVIDEPEKCGLGEGVTCCAYLTLGWPRFVCGRTIESTVAILEDELAGVAVRRTFVDIIRKRLAAGTMMAKGDPGDTPYPECQNARLRPNADDIVGDMPRKQTVESDGTVVTEPTLKEVIKAWRQTRKLSDD